MMRQIIASASVVLAVGTLCFACKPGGVGDPCIPNDEFSETYGGASETGVAIEDRSFQCETRVCLVKNFRGRVSCPFGNKAGRNNASVKGYDKDDADVCKVPGTNKNVTAPVQSQCKERTAQVYCSCRCAGKESNTKYCECPSGYTCKEVSSSLGDFVASGDKYCVKSNDTASDGYNCAEGGCDQDDNRCGFTSNAFEF